MSLLFSHSVISEPLSPHGLQHIRFPCPSLSPGTCSNSFPLCRWCHPTISSSVLPFSSHLHFFPASGSFPMSQSFTSVGQVLEFQPQHQSFQWKFRTDFLYHWLVRSPCSTKDSRVFSNTMVQMHQFFGAWPSLWSNFHITYMTAGKTVALTIQTFVGKVMSLLFIMLSKFVIVFLPRSKYVLISWLQSPSAVTLEPKKIYCFNITDGQSLFCFM